MVGGAEKTEKAIAMLLFQMTPAKGLAFILMFPFPPRMTNSCWPVLVSLKHLDVNIG